MNKHLLGPHFVQAGKPLFEVVSVLFLTLLPRTGSSGETEPFQLRTEPRFVLYMHPPLGNDRLSRLSSFGQALSEKGEVPAQTFTLLLELYTLF